MVRYWQDILGRAIHASLQAIGTTFGAITYTFLVMALAVAFVGYRKGWAAMKTSILELIGGAVLFAVITWLPIFAWQLMRAPYKLDSDKQKLIDAADGAISELKRTIETRRPYLLVEELPPSEVRAVLTGADPAQIARTEGDYSRAWLVGYSPDAETLLFQTRNVGDVPAREITFHHKITLTAAGVESEIPLPPLLEQSLTLLPGQAVRRSFVFPSGTLYTSGHPTEGIVRILVAVAFSGPRGTVTKYYYKVVLKSGRFANVEEMNRNRVGGVTIESTDEGTFINLNDVLSMRSP